MNKYQKELENLNTARLNINTVCQWLPEIVLKNIEDFGGEYDVYHYVNQGILKELVEKETPMEVNMEDYHLEDEYQYPIYSCPKCAKHITDGDSYCRHCGQRLLFIDIEESDDNE